VKIGVRRDAMVEILDGLVAGDQVVTAGMRLSRDGQPVRVLVPGQGGPSKGGTESGKDAAPKAGAAPAAPKADAARGSVQS
jgi:membrane fusion protein, multidrug efflux system